VRPTLAVGRLLGDSLKMCKVAYDWLKVGSRRSRDPLSGSRMPLCTSRTNRLAASRRPASRSHSCDKHTIGQLLHTMHSPPCHNALSRLVATPTHRPFCLLQRRVSHGSRLASLPARGIAKQHSVDRRCKWYGCVGCSEVAYRRNICEFEWRFRSR